MTELVTRTQAEEDSKRNAEAGSAKGVPGMLNVPLQTETERRKEELTRRTSPLQ
jgi:hypothetical protein